MNKRVSLVVAVAVGVGLYFLAFDSDEPTPEQHTTHTEPSRQTERPPAPDESISEATFESELVACKRLAAEKGLNLTSFVYPKNSIGHTGLLTKHGFKVYRGPQPSWFDGTRGLIWSIAHKIDTYFPIVPPVVFPSAVNGIWNLPASYYYVHRDRWGRWLPIWMRVWKAKKAIRKAARLKGMFHIWFHPYNLATDIDGLFSGLEQIFAEVNKLRDDGQLVNLTMGELAERLDTEYTGSTEDEPSKV